MNEILQIERQLSLLYRVPDVLAGVGSHGAQIEVPEFYGKVCEKVLRGWIYFPCNLKGDTVVQLSSYLHLRTGARLKGEAGYFSPYFSKACRITRCDQSVRKINGTSLKGDVAYLYIRFR